MREFFTLKKFIYDKQTFLIFLCALHPIEVNFKQFNIPCINQYESKNYFSDKQKNIRLEETGFFYRPVLKLVL